MHLQQRCTGNLAASIPRLRLKPGVRATASPGFMGADCCSRGDAHQHDGNVLTSEGVPLLSTAV